VPADVQNVHFLADSPDAIVVLEFGDMRATRRSLPA
jgi:hypothetical protein